MAQGEFATRQSVFDRVWRQTFSHYLPVTATAKPFEIMTISIPSPKRALSRIDLRKLGRSDRTSVERSQFGAEWALRPSMCCNFLVH